MDVREVILAHLSFGYCKRFSVTWKELNPPRRNMRIAVTTDGRTTNEYSHTMEDVSGKSEGAEARDGRVRHYMFDNIKLTGMYIRGQSQPASRLSKTMRSNLLNR